MKDLRVEIRFKNAFLWRALQDQFPLPQGVRQSYWSPAKQAADGCGVSYNTILQFLTLKLCPYRTTDWQGHKAGTAKESALTIAEFLRQSVGRLFPQQLYAVNWPTISGEMPSARLLSFAEARQQKLLPQSCEMESELIEKIDGSDVKTADRLRAVLNTLTPREEKVLKMRFGLDDGNEHTLDEVGQCFAVTRERMRQIEAKALRKLRSPSRLRYIRGDKDSSDPF